MSLLRTFQHIRVGEIGDGVYPIFPTKSGWAGANAGVIDLGDRTVVVDTLLTPAAARELFAAAQHLTGRRAGLVVNTHYHSDHAWGNQVCADDVEIIASAGTRALFLDAGPEEVAWYRKVAPAEIARIDALLAAPDTRPPAAAAQRRQRLETGRRFYQAALATLADLVLRPPTLTFTRHLALHGSRRSVDILSFGGGHTRSDSIVSVADEALIFAGDLVTVAAHPYLPDGNPADWVHILDQIRALQPRLIVPGHGPAGGIEALAEMAAYLSAVTLAVAEAMMHGIEAIPTIDEFIAQTPIPPSFAQWEFAAFFAQNLRFLYQRMREVLTA